jgi:hypothetical protein
MTYLVDTHIFIVYRNILKEEVNLLTEDREIINADILTETQKNVLERLAGALSGTDFYLAGGTALAIQIGHRISVDFDWFIPRLGDPDILFQKIKKAGIDYTVVSIDIETLMMQNTNLR